MKKFIVITTIFEPGEAIEKFSQQDDYTLVVVGDNKTPKDWHFDNTVFLPITEQVNGSSKFLLALPQNHYCRKIAGYLYAIKNGADVIAESDDDNIPYQGWDFPNFYGNYDMAEPNQGIINIYNFFTTQKIWPRGLPLNKILSSVNTNTYKSYVNVGVWQALADQDPDVDAVYRLTSNQPCVFEKRNPVILPSSTYAPFNTQNTATCKELFPLLYLPSHVTFRFTDILRGIVAQPIMNKAGYCLGFTQATVFQKRNDHDYSRDFESEIPMYLQVEKALEIAKECSKTGVSVSNNLFDVYCGLEKAGIVNTRELEILELWLKEIN